ncbi:Zinc finger protein 248 [Araneus ventricosus]|uniref:Zinc finger protein 248 n=1 Tax=Araneus ventricosus TaxID=182803 RepID=A0A4Y2RLR4_ARAVE|nr:Zinc finger protein 248 [Araneus ventricosus]
MGRYLCQLCYTIVNYGEKHPCFFYKNDDNVYSLPELRDSNKMDTKNGHLTANSSDNSVVIFTEEQQNNAKIPEQINTWLTESHRQFSLRDASKTKGRPNSFYSKVSNTEQGNPSNTLLSGPLFNVHSRIVHSTENQTACFLNLSENFESACRCQVDTRGASKRKSRRPVPVERNNGKKTDSTSFQAATNEKCETWHDEGCWHPLTEDESCFSKSHENVSQESQFHLKNISAAPNFPTNFALPPRFLQTKQDVIKLSGHDSYRDAHLISNTSIPKSSTCIYKGIWSSKSIPVSTGFSETNIFVREQMLENNNEEAQHQRTSEVASKGCNNISNVSPDNAVSVASMSDADPIAGPSRMNVAAQYSAEHGKFICPECGKNFCQKETLVVHYRTHTGEKPFPCDSCDKRFPSKSDLKKHSRTHTGERPFKCPICKKAFSNSSNRIKHYRNMHNKK